MKKNTQTVPLIKYMILATSVLFLLLSLVLAPLYVYTASDFTVSVTAIPELLDSVIELTEVFAFALCYSFIIFAAIIYSAKKAAVLSGIYIAACFIRRALDLLITFLTYNYIDGLDISSVVFAVIMESAQVLVVLLLATRAAKAYHMQRAELKKAAQHLGSQLNGDPLGFNKIFSKANPMHSTMLIAGIMLSVIKIISRIRYDIFYASVYGAPSSGAEIITMIVYYFFDVFVCVGFYVICWLLLSKLCEKNKKLTEISE
ncbi:MAG: hypothetical protein E7653_00395 [Ruminococcaceae bacterium]|nr:hypothetical protein [Oscillospiraceae bacterium]